MINYRTILAFTLLLFTSCKSVKNISSNEISKNIKFKKLEKIIEQNEFRYDNFSSKIRVIYNNQNFTANLRIKKDSIIWISLTGPFNIEGARIRIQNNRFEMIDKLHRRYYNKPLSYIKNYFPVELDYKMLENILVGNFIENRIKKQKTETIEGQYVVKGSIGGLDTEYKINPSGKLENINIQDNINNINLKIDYSKYETIIEQLFSFRRKYVIDLENVENLLDLKFYNTSNKKNIFPFNIPKGYAVE